MNYRQALNKPDRNKSVECHGNDLEQTCADIKAKGGVIESLEAGVRRNPAQYRINYSKRGTETTNPNRDSQ